MAERRKLKVYLGFAPGVGKARATSSEGHDLCSRGHEVVIGLVEHHGRERTKKLIEGLSMLDHRRVSYRGNTYHELDVDAVIEMHPEVALVDELAHTVVTDEPDNEPVQQHKRRHDVHQFLDAGIDVISTMNIQHLESLNDVVAVVTGVRQMETVPDRILRDADEIEFIDLSPDALRIRLSRGGIYRKEQTELALRKYFRPGNLSALCELALSWLANKVEEVLDAYREDREINDHWTARERVVVAVRDDKNAEPMICRGVRMSGRVAGREMIVVHITGEDDGLGCGYLCRLRKLQDLTESLGGQQRTIVGDDVPGILLEFSHTVNTSQLVIGSERGLRRYVGLSTSQRIIGQAEPIDVHIISSSSERKAKRRKKLRSCFSKEQHVTGWLLALVGLMLLTLLLYQLDTGPEFLGVLLLTYLMPIVFAAMAAGLVPALVAVVVSSILANWYFTTPVNILTITEPASLAQILLFGVITVAVATVVERSERRREMADRNLHQTVIMSELAHGVVHDDDNMSNLVHSLVDMFSMEHVDVQRCSSERKKWLTIVTTAGHSLSEPWPTELPMTKVSSGDDLRFVFSGRRLTAVEAAMIAAHGSHTRALMDMEEITAMRRATAALEAGNRVGSAVLTAVSHDLRTPLASIKAAISSMSMEDVELDDETRLILMETIESFADRLGVVIGNLPDASRIDSSTKRVESVPVSVSDAAGAVCMELPEATSHIDRDIDHDACMVEGDSGLIQRIVSNIVIDDRQYVPESSLTIHARLSERGVCDPADTPVMGSLGTIITSVCINILIINHGKGIPEDKLEEIFQPFQHLGGYSAQPQGLSLGLAAASRFADAMGGAIRVEQTPGGGTTFVLTLPRAMGERRQGSINLSSG